MELTARDIHEKQFRDAFRGYNQEEVDDFLDHVAEALEHLRRENESLRERVRELDQAVATSRETEDMLKKTLLTAQQAAEEALARAKAKAAQIVADAEQEASGMTERARTALAEAESEARRKAADSEREVSARRREVDATIERLRAYETDLKSRLRSFLDQQLRALEQLSEHPGSGAAGEPAESEAPEVEISPTAAPDDAGGGILGRERRIRSLFHGEDQ